MAEDFTLEGKVDLNTTSLTSNLASAALQFDVLMVAGKMAMDEIEKAYASTVGAMLEFGDDVGKQATILGVSTDEIQKLKNGAAAVGVDMDTATQAVKMFSMRMDESSTSGQALRAQVAGLGISLNDADGNARPLTAVFMDINTQLGKMEDPIKRNALANDLYGRSWSNIADMIGEADTSYAGYKSNDGLIKHEDIMMAKDLADQMFVLDQKMKGIGYTVGEEMLPAMQTLLDSLNSMPSAGEGVTSALNAIDNALKAVIFTVTMAIFGLREMNAALEDVQNRDTNMTKTKVIAAEAAAYVNKLKAGTPAEVPNSKGVGSKNGMVQDTSGNWVSPGAQPSAGASGKTHGAFGDVDPRFLPVDANGNQKSQIGFGANGLPIYSDNPYANNGSDSGYSGPYADISQMSSGLKYAQVGDIWKYADQNTDSSSQSSDFLAQIRAIKSHADSVTAGFRGGATWQNTSENESIANQTLALYAQYAAQKSGSAGITQINYIQGANAQDVANQIAEATSRALARQVTS